MKTDNVKNIVNSYTRYQFDYKQIRKYEKIESLDTETKNGECKLLLYTLSGRNNFYYNQDFNDTLKKLFELPKNNIYFCYNLHYDVKSLFKTIFRVLKNDTEKRDFCKNFMNSFKILINCNQELKEKYPGYVLDNDNIKFSNIIIQYIKNKWCFISCHKFSIYLYDIAQFYDKKKLDYSCLNNLNFCSKCKFNIGKEIIRQEKEQKKHLIKYNDGEKINCFKCSKTHEIKRKIFIEPVKEKNFYNNDKVLINPGLLEYQNLTLKEVKEHNDFLSYGLKDIIRTTELGEHLYNLFERFGLIINKPISHAHLFKKTYAKFNSVYDNLYTIPFKNKISYGFRLKFIQYLINAFYGGNFTVLKKGYFPNIYYKDINSSYPNLQRKLRSFLNAQIVFLIGEHKDLDFYDDGVMKVEIKQTHDLINPFPLRTLNNVIVYPKTNKNESFTTYILKSEFDYYKNLNFIDIKIVDGYYFKYDDNAIYPFLFMENLYNERVILKEQDDPLQQLLKLILNAGYGSLIQLTGIPLLLPYITKNLLKYKNQKFKIRDYNGNLFIEVIEKYKNGILFNPYNAGFITAHGKINLIDPFMNSNKTNYTEQINDLIFLATDSHVTTSDVKVDETKNKLGAYKTEIKKVSGTVLSNGTYYIGTDIKHLRGYDTEKKLDVIMNESEPGNKIININTKKIFGHGDKNINNFNVMIEDYKKTINLNKDVKRVWNNNDLTVKDLLNNNYTSSSIIYKKENFKDYIS